ncbi:MULTISPECIES: LysR family transcriptional regulator [Sorangium]|uniref:LysR family transcriptional regulator n=1 Tax=Sorangium cellulosum TaxID=56 RepID=A0A4P2QF06_SORCE|nr:MULTISPECIES: LysR family transcriptional regulator [Sorangium]AUX28041.1 LysR family transcriptional regulator [Sorangium cellulosum]WCQ87446.1 HTH-type transcriptional activator CmpR [Sorangium sp. Soce836]
MDASLLPALEDVLLVARSGSVAEAARRLHKTPSAISQQVRRVEEHFGVALFERDGRGVRLSPAGEAALGAITRLFDQAEGVFELLSELAGEPSTTLRLAASDYLGKGLLVPVIRQMLEQRAPVRFAITTANSIDAARWVERGEVDLGLASASSAGGDLVKQPLFVQPFLWVGPRLKGKAPALRDRLRHEPLLRLAPGSVGRRLLDAYLDRERIRPISTIDVSSVSLLVSYVSGGLGIGLAPALALTEVARSRLDVEIAEEVEPLPVELMTRENFRRNPIIERFIERLAAEGRRAEQRTRALLRA